MCMITLLPPLNDMNKEIDYQLFHNAWNKNNHGCGMSYVQGIENNVPEIKIHKGFTKINKFLNQFKKHREENPLSKFMIHFRYSTYGEISINNCHPFMVSHKKISMAHNGTLYKLNAQKDIGPSDSKILANIISTLPEEWENKPIYIKLIQRYIGEYNRVAFLTYTNHVWYLNPTKWFKENDILFSSEYYKTKPPEIYNNLCEHCKINVGTTLYNKHYYCFKCFDIITNSLDKSIESNNGICKECGLELNSDYERTQKLCGYCIDKINKRNQNIYMEDV